MQPATQHAPEPRRLVCERCGSTFACGLAADCWCADESFRLPMPAGGADCLCPACLRAAAARLGSAQA